MLLREGDVYALMRQYDRAIEIYRKVLGLNPNLTGAQRNLSVVLSQQGRYQEAIAHTSQFQTPALSAMKAYLYSRAGRRGEALKLLRQLKARAAHEFVSPVSIARIYIGLGNKEQALIWLLKAYDKRSDHLVNVGTDPAFDPLHSDPRFDELLRDIGLG